MRKVLVCIVFVMIVILVLGVVWGRLFKRGYTQDEYGIELAMRDQKKEELEDSIKKMRLKLETYDEAVKWFRNANPEELQRGIEQIRNVPNNVPLP